MCPMRFLLVFFSAVLAGYMAWKSVRTSSESKADVFDEDSSVNKQESSIVKWEVSMEEPKPNKARRQSEKFLESSSLGLTINPDPVIIGKLEHYA
ncbi:hypothetical protein E3N88_24495 [Mikania micrantha]|uniref:Uncharacterized protein n=1 Tax=Mikania micrantha TaxID=192012 RepID=A0A5N6N2L4_9ASTR|nr:hypothetical protein E3N88_24495 [Mikania micrantha]